MEQLQFSNKSECCYSIIIACLNGDACGAEITHVTFEHSIFDVKYDPNVFLTGFVRFTPQFISLTLSLSTSVSFLFYFLYFSVSERSVVRQVMCGWSNEAWEIQRLNIDFH